VNHSPHDHVIFTDVDGVEGVLVDLNTKQYYRLNETASMVWRGLAGGTSLDGIVKEITDAYDVTPEHAQSSVDAIIRSFIAYRLLKPLA
jgi:Coenzyme PQQ synthesis protein D (PqqD)